VKGSIADQAYGGYDVENPLANSAIDRTRDLVLLYEGRPANAVYSSTCGGTTARASEVWRATPDQPYLVPVSDAIAGTDRHYCDIAPRFRWTRTLAAAELDKALAQYLAAYASGGPNGTPGRARMVSVRTRTATDRVDALDIETDGGTYVVRKNDTRYVLRAPGGETLNSTYFSVEPEIAADGALSRITLRGRGYGHGVGMCQWGAIGRARAGQSFRTILGTYYPGTTVGTIQ
jgi:stage II sporulation protein D